MDAFAERLSQIDSTIALVFLIIGILGSLFFSFSGPPQAYKAIKDKHANGLALITLWMWLLGEVFTLAYTLYFYPGDFVYLVQLIVNTIAVSVIAWFFYFGKKSKTRLKRNLRRKLRRRKR